MQLFYNFHKYVGLVFKTFYSWLSESFIHGQKCLPLEPVVIESKDKMVRHYYFLLAMEQHFALFLLQINILVIKTVGLLSLWTLFLFYFIFMLLFLLSRAFFVSYLHVIYSL